MHGFLLAVVAVAALVAGGDASVGNVDPLMQQNNVVDDNTVLEQLGKTGGVDVIAFTTEYLLHHKLDVNYADVLPVLSKISDIGSGNPSVLGNLGKILELASELKKKIASCAATADRKLADYVDTSDSSAVREKLAVVNAGWTCASSTVADPSVDWAYLEMVRNMLQNNPRGAVEIVLSFLKKYDIISDKSTPIVMMVTEQMLEHNIVTSAGLAIVDNFETFFKSESGRRFYKVIPRMLSASPDEMVEILSKEADYNQAAFFNQLESSDVAKYFVRSIAQMLLSGYNLLRESLDDSLKFAVINGMLVSNNFPPISKRNLLKSVLAIIEKASTFVTAPGESFKLQNHANDMIEEFERLYMRVDHMKKLNQEELENVLVQFLLDNVIVPMKAGWIASRGVSRVGGDCAEAILCLMNEKVASSNRIVRTVTQGVSMFLAYSWSSQMDNVSYVKLYKAVHSGSDAPSAIDGNAVGAAATSCAAKYSAANGDCDVFASHHSHMMSLSYEHTEL
jgi:hypothetical protein